MKILSVVHSEHARTELFRRPGHELEEWYFAGQGAPPDDYDAIMVFGGSMHADQDDLHGWLPTEVEWLRGVVDRGTPVLGVCLGAQLLARAYGGGARRLEGGPEIGWHEVERVDSDPVLDVLPRSFEALEWHHYTYDVPPGAVELARNERCNQAFRLGDSCWAVQFHPEVTHAQVLTWIDEEAGSAFGGAGDDPPVSPEQLRAEMHEKIARWNELGLALCDAFLAAAERTLARAA